MVSIVSWTVARWARHAATAEVQWVRHWGGTDSTRTCSATEFVAMAITKPQGTLQPAHDVRNLQVGSNLVFATEPSSDSKLI